MRVFAWTRERERAWKMGSYCFVASLVTAPVRRISARRLFPDAAANPGAVYNDDPQVKTILDIC